VEEPIPFLPAHELVELAALVDWHLVVLVTQNSMATAGIMDWHLQRPRPYPVAVAPGHWAAVHFQPLPRAQERRVESLGPEELVDAS
jgi:hypothetical protein